MDGIHDILININLSVAKEGMTWKGDESYVKMKSWRDAKIQRCKDEVKNQKHQKHQHQQSHCPSTLTSTLVDQSQSPSPELVQLDLSLTHANLFVRPQSRFFCLSIRSFIHLCILHLFVPSCMQPSPAFCSLSFPFLPSCTTVI